MRLLALLLLLAACGSTPPPPPRDDAADVAIASARDAVKELGGTLKARLTAVMREGGPVAALDVCSSEASDLTAQVNAKLGVRVGRATLKPRNPANAGPEWVQAWLEQAGAKPASEAMPVVEVVDTPGGRVAHVIKPIAIEAPCLACHGPVEGLAPEIRAKLTAAYPQDQATGYALGDLRGALWAEAPVGK